MKLMKMRTMKIGIILIAFQFVGIFGKILQGINPIVEFIVKIQYVIGIAELLGFYSWSIAGIVFIVISIRRQKLIQQYDELYGNEQEDSQYNDEEQNFLIVSLFIPLNMPKPVGESDGFLPYDVDKLPITMYVISVDMSTKSFFGGSFLWLLSFSKESNSKEI